MTGRGGGKPREGTEEVSKVVKYLGIGRGKHMGAGDLFQGGGSVDSSLRVRYVGDDPPNGPGPKGVLEQGGPLDNKKAVMAASEWKLGVTAPPP